MTLLEGSQPGDFATFIHTDHQIGRVYQYLHNAETVILTTFVHTLLRSYLQILVTLFSLVVK